MATGDSRFCGIQVERVRAPANSSLAVQVYVPGRVHDEVITTTAIDYAVGFPIGAYGQGPVVTPVTVFAGGLTTGPIVLGC